MKRTRENWNKAGRKALPKKETQENPSLLPLRRKTLLEISSREGRRGGAELLLALILIEDQSAKEIVIGSRFPRKKSTLEERPGLNYITKRRLVNRTDWVLTVGDSGKGTTFTQEGREVQLREGRISKYEARPGCSSLDRTDRVMEKKE